MNESINQSKLMLNEWMNEWMNQSINQSINQSKTNVEFHIWTLSAIILSQTKDIFTRGKKLKYFFCKQI